MTLLLTILAVIVFFVGAYYMGNLAMDDFDEDIYTRSINIGLGMLIWMLLLCLFMLFVVVYHYIGIALK